MTNTTITGTTVQIDGLAASTSYDVEVRAKNAEGASEWSNPGIGSTNAPGSNNPPVFTDGSSTTRSVSATAPAGTNIGDPIRATDADAGEVISYRLEGRDAANFTINSATGQLQTKADVVLIAGEDYSVSVVADDGDDTTRITVTISATAGAPNNAPVFAAGATTTRSVSESVAAGTNIGDAVAATDADTGDTLTYTLGGTDAASFDIVATTGQLQTKATLDASTKSTYTVTVTATDSAGATATITVTITVTTSTLGPLGDQYDANSNGVIERTEVIAAIRDYFSDVITRDDVIAIIRLYFSG